MPSHLRTDKVGFGSLSFVVHQAHADYYRLCRQSAVVVRDIYRL
jgi:predicted transcriptional regulator